MIEYSGLCSHFRLHGSVLPKAVMWAAPCSCLIFFYRALFEWLWPGFLDEMQKPSTAEAAAIGLFTSILGFSIVFRANIAYGRFWEGITLVERACAVWLNGVSNLVAFSNAGVDRQAEVAAFQHLLSRLMSLLLSISLGDISRLDSGNFPPLSLSGINPESLAYLDSAHSKQKVVLQWVQRLVVEQERIGVLDVSPPILSRVFQEFSLGIVHFIDARKATCVPFPFAFAQVVGVMLMLCSTVLMPLTCAVYMQVSLAVPTTFLVIFMYTGIHYISLEIEQPFGGDPNDLPLEDINRDFNNALMTLLEAEAQQTPILVSSTDEIKQHARICRDIARRRSMTSEAPVVTVSSICSTSQERRLSKLGNIWSRLSSQSVGKIQILSSSDEEAHQTSSYKFAESDAASSVRAPSKSSCGSSAWAGAMPSIVERHMKPVATWNTDRSLVEVVEYDGDEQASELDPQDLQQLRQQRQQQQSQEQTQKHLHAQRQAQMQVAPDGLAAIVPHQPQRVEPGTGSQSCFGRASPQPSSLRPGDNVKTSRSMRPNSTGISPEVSVRPSKSSPPTKLRTQESW